MFDGRLSPTALNLFRECSRCLWLDKVKGVRRPRGIFPSLPSGMDLAIKQYFDIHRKAGTLPPEMHSDALDGASLFPDQGLINAWRDWRSGLKYKDNSGATLFGAIDDLILQGDAYIPLDYKTKGSPTSQEDSEKYYQSQLDCYSLMLKGNGMRPAEFGVLLYFSPKRVFPDGNVLFDIQTIKVQADPQRALSVLRTAYEVLKGAIPQAGATCEYCIWQTQLAAAQ